MHNADKTQVADGTGENIKQIFQYEDPQNKQVDLRNLVKES